MEVPITQFRRDLFDLVERALRGEAIALTYKGQRVHLVPEPDPATRFDNITPLQVINPNYPGDMQDAKRQIMTEMEKEWEQDWSQL